jgi:hypothetical protein
MSSKRNAASSVNQLAGTINLVCLPVFGCSLFLSGTTVRISLLSYLTNYNFSQSFVWTWTVLSPFEVLGLLRLQKLENGIENPQDLDILYYRFLQNLQCRIFLHKLSIYAFIYPLYLRVHTSCAYLVIPIILV